MGSKTILDWREDPDAEPEVRIKDIETFCRQIMKNPNKVDLETLVIIEHNKTWFRAYREIMNRMRSDEQK